MAKKKETKDKSKDTIKEVRECLYLTADHIMNLRRVLIPWSPTFDDILGGGIVSGSMTNMSGLPKTGKTSTFLQLIRNAQKPEYGGRYWDKEAATKRGQTPGRPVFFYSTENRLTKRDLLGVPGLNLEPDKFMIIAATDTQTPYLEDVTMSIEQTIEMYPGCIIIVDSVGSLCSKTVAVATADGQVRDPSPVLISQFMKRIGQLIMAKDIIFLNVLHKVANPSGYGKSTQVTGGNKLKFGANNIIDLTWSEIDKDNDGCYILHLVCETSELGPPNQTGDAYLKFGVGLWEPYEMLLLVTSPDCNNLFGVNKGGSWFTFFPEITGTDTPVKKQGITAATGYLEENPKIVKKLYKQYAESCWENSLLYSK